MESKAGTSAKTIIAPGTPSPRKRKRAESPVPNSRAHHRPLKRPELPPTHIPRASNLLSALKVDSGVGKSGNKAEDALRRDITQSTRPHRDAQTLTIIENLEIGPYEHNPPNDDPNFDGLEPHSSIRLSQRVTAHEDIYELLTGRYYLSPSTLYSIVRPSTNRQGYDIPVDGEWVTIAVVAERGPIRLSRTGANDGPADDEEDSKNAGSTTTKRRSGPRKYTTIKLVDMGGASLDGNGKSVRGDAYLNMLLFEADNVSTSRDESSRKVDRSYKGGSGGAFENSARLSEGSVIAICAPKLLKPYQSGNDQLHPKLNILGLTPTDAASITVIGRARDLGHCTSLKRDGKACGSWCDLRVAKVCDYHLQQAVTSRRAGRAEFSVGTSGMSFGGGAKSSGSYDPSRKTGLLPKGPQSVPKSAQNLSADTGAMYIVGSQVIRPSLADIGMDEFVSEKIGREKQEQQKRRRERLDEEERLNKLLSRDGGLTTGAKALNQALGITSKNDGGDTAAKSSFSAEAVKHIGFDPSGAKQALTDADVKRKLGMLEDLQKMNRNISLAKRPSTSTSSTSNLDTAAEESTAPPSVAGEDDDDSELEIED